MITPFNDHQFRQYAALQTNLGWGRMSPQTVIQLSGRDRAPLLNNLATQAVVDRSPGDGCELFLANVQGKIQGFAVALIREDDILLVSAPHQADRLMPHIDRYIISEDASLTDLSDRWCQVLIAGPNAAQRLSQRLSTRLDDIPSSPWQHRRDGELLVVASQWPTSGFQVMGAPETVEAWLSDIIHQGDAIECEPDVLEACRIEQRFPLYGTDITTDNLPQEVDRNKLAINFEKGCYLGQETVARIDALGHVNWLFRALQLGDAVESPMEQLPCEIGQPRSLARLTSASWSPQHNAVVALGYVRRGHEKPGTTIEWPGGSATVLAQP